MCCYECWRKEGKAETCLYQDVSEVVLSTVQMPFSRSAHPTFRLPDNGLSATTFQPRDCQCSASHTHTCTSVIPIWAAHPDDICSCAGWSLAAEVAGDIDNHWFCLQHLPGFVKLLKIHFTALPVWLVRRLGSPHKWWEGHRKVKRTVTWLVNRPTASSVRKTVLSTELH